MNKDEVYDRYSLKKEYIGQILPYRAVGKITLFLFFFSIILFLIGMFFISYIGLSDQKRDYFPLIIFLSALIVIVINLYFIKKNKTNSFLPFKSLIAGTSQDGLVCLNYGNGGLINNEGNELDYIFIPYENLVVDLSLISYKSYDQVIILKNKEESKNVQIVRDFHLLEFDFFDFINELKMNISDKRSFITEGKKRNAVFRGGIYLIILAFISFQIFLIFIKMKRNSPFWGVLIALSPCLFSFFYYRSTKKKERRVYRLLNHWEKEKTRLF